MTDEKTCSAVSKKRGPKKSETRKISEAAGLSRAWMWRALQVANIPQDEFEQLIESDDPPTVAKLVKIGSGNESTPEGRRLRRCPHCGGDLT